MSFFQSNKKWASYEQGDFTFLENNNYHQKLFRLNIRYSNNKSKVQVDESIHENNQGKVSSSGEVKFQFPIVSKDRTIYSRISSQGKLGVYYDNGMIDLNGFKLNLYSGFQSNRTFTDKVYKLGASISGENYLYALRVRGGGIYNQLYLHAKGRLEGNVNSNRWKFNFFTLMDPKFGKLIKNGMLFGWLMGNEAKDTFYVRVQSGKKNFKGITWCQCLKQYRLNWTHQLNPNSKIGAQTKINFGNWQHLWTNAAVGGEWKFLQENTTIRGKINANSSATISITNQLKDYGLFTFGVEWSDIGMKNNFKFGTAVEMNL